MLSPITESQYADALNRISELERELAAERTKRKRAEAMMRAAIRSMEEKLCASALVNAPRCDWPTCDCLDGQHCRGFPNRPAATAPREG